MQTLIVYYSRTNTTKELAGKLQENFTADILQIEDQKKREGFLYLLKASFDALTANVTLINQFSHNLEEYDLVLVGSPIWAASITPAIRTFLLGNSEVLPRLAFFVTHAGGGSGRSKKQFKKIAGQEPLAFLSVKDDEVKKDDESFKNKLAEFEREIITNFKS